MTIKELTAIATANGLTVRINKTQTIARQRQAVLDQLRDAGVKVDRQVAGTKLTSCF